jgi:hypothetical protein
MKRETIVAAVCGLPCGLAAGGEVPAGAPAPDCGWTLTASGPLIEMNDAAAFDDGSGRSLFACGRFNFTGTNVAAHLLRWNGDSWSYAGTDFPPDLLDRGTALSLSVFEEDGTELLYVGGLWTPVGGGLASAVARWDGAAWDLIAPEVVGGDGVDTIVFDDGTGPALYVGGGLTLDNKLSYTPVVKWDGSAWSDAAPNMSGSWVYALAVFDDGDGPALYAGGELRVDDQPARIAKLSGSTWTAIPGQPAFTINALCVHDDGSGEALYIAAGGADAIRRWDGTAWTDLNVGDVWSQVFGLSSFDDGSVTRLYAVGITATDKTPVTVGARYWDGVSWPLVGDRYDIYNTSAIPVYDDGSGPAVFATPVVVRGSATEPRVEGISRYVRWQTRCPDALRADYLSDCQSNFFDVRAFIDLFLAQDPAADFNADGSLDFADASDFIDAFVAGCP